MIDWKGLIVGLIGVIIVVGIGWIVVDTQLIQVREYCEGLVLNGTINNISECNVTVLAVAEMHGMNLSVADG